MMHNLVILVENVNGNCNFFFFNFVRLDIVRK